MIPVGHTIAWLLAPGEEVPSQDPSSRHLNVGGPPSNRLQEAKPEVAFRSLTESRNAKLSPKARRLAKEHNIDLSLVRGSGSDGEILAADILDAVRSRDLVVPIPSAGNRTDRPASELSTIARLMAERTTESWTTIPHFFVQREVQATALVQARGKIAPRIETSHDIHPTYTDLLVALVAQTLLNHPRLNASWTGMGIRLNPEINIGLAMAVEDSVTTAVVRDAAVLPIGEIAVRRRALTERARVNRLRSEDITGATFTISNLGMHNVDSFTAIIVPPQAAILAVGAIRDHVVAIDQQVAIRSVLTLTLSCDHRVVSGQHGAEFLNDLAKTIHEAELHLQRRT